MCVDVCVEITVIEHNGAMRTRCYRFEARVDCIDNAANMLNTMANGYCHVGVHNMRTQHINSMSSAARHGHIIALGPGRSPNRVVSSRGKNEGKGE